MPSAKHLRELQIIVDYVESNLNSEISVLDVCSYGAFSRWEIQRLFRAYTGDTIGNYIRGRRLTKAAQILLNGDGDNILDIAIEFQFGSQEAFARAFKNQFGITPGQMRKEGSRRLVKAKPQLKSGRLAYIASKVSRSPEIKLIPAMTLKGRSIQIESTLGSENDTYGLVKNLWSNFFNEIPLVPRDNAYGLIFGSDQSMSDERLNYVASVEAKLTLGFELEQYEVAENSYAIFETTGQKQSCHFIADYIYGIWLPQSEYRRAEGYDFELLNCESPGIVRYHIPIQKK